MQTAWFKTLLACLLQVCNDDQRERLLLRIRTHVTELKKYQYGKHILTRVEKLLSAGTRIQTGQRSGPINVGVVVQVGAPVMPTGPQAAATAAMGGMLATSTTALAGSVQHMSPGGREAAPDFDEGLGRSIGEESCWSQDQGEARGTAGVDLANPSAAAIGPAVQSDNCSEALAALKLLL